MPESVSIRERIGRVLKVQAETMTDVGDVYRWDARPGQSAKAMLDVVIELGEETGTDGDEGSTGTTWRRLLATVGAYIALDEGASETTDRIVNRWLGRIEAAVMDNERLTETTSPNNVLCISVRWVGNRDPIFQDGMVWAACEFEIIYETDRDSPYTGPGISLLTE